MTRSEIRTRILEALNESASSPVFWSTDQIDEVIDEAQEVLAEEADAIKRSALIPLQNGIQFYSTKTMGSEVMVPYRIWDHTNSRRLDATTMSELDLRHETWITVTGNPECWFPVSWDLFGVYPFPASAGGVLRADCLAWPRSLLDDSDEPEFPESDHDALVIYGVYDGLLKQWDFERAMLMFSGFMNKWAKAKYRAGVGRLESKDFVRNGAEGLR